VTPPVDFQAAYSQAVSDRRRREFYRSCERQTLAWLVASAVLVGALVGAFVASGDAAQIAERLLRSVGL
jgi:hypothetical protein